MKKVFIAILFSLFTVSQASAEAGVNVGIAGNIGLFAASADEKATETHSGSEHGAAGWASIFIEKSIGDRFAIGIDYVPDALESETTETSKQDKTDSDTASSKTNTLQVDFEDLTTLYAMVNVGDGGYIRAGMVKVDVVTNENLGTGSTYGNVSLDGTLLGIGFNRSMDNGVFIRAEASYMSFDDASATSNDNTITLTNLDGVTAGLKLGKTF